MALVKFNAGIASITGKVAGFYFSRDGSGEHIRKLPAKKSHATAKQFSVRKAYRQILNLFYYGDISQSDLDKWYQYCTTHPVTNALGERHYLKPFNWFLRFNMPRIRNNLDAIMSPPS